MNYEFGYSMLFLEIIGFVAEFCGKVARSVYAFNYRKNKVGYDMKSEIVINLLRSALFGAAFIGFPPSLIELEAAPASSERWHRSSSSTII